MLTGLYPEMMRRPPVASVHPRNFFSLLAPQYRMNIVETHTQLYGDDRPKEPLGERLGSLVSDLGLVYLHIGDEKRSRMWMARATRLATDNKVKDFYSTKIARLKAASR